jgi:hypothetical protein
MNRQLHDFLKKLPLFRPFTLKMDELRREFEREADRLGRQANEALYFHFKHLKPEEYPQALADWYRLKTGEMLDLAHPRTFNEKIQWLKLYGATPLKTRLVDKHLAREYVREKIGERHLITLLGVWDRFDDIDFAVLPGRFALKANHGSGWNVIVRDKSSMDRNLAKRMFDEWLRLDFAFCKGLELDYRGIPPKIVAEAYIENSNGQLYDYKVWCFGGKACYVMFLADRGTKLKMIYHDRDWVPQPFVYNYPRYEKPVPRPSNLDELLAKAETLAAGFPFVRVDFYRLNDGSLKFGEMTFTPYSGVCHWTPPEWNAKLGEMIPLPREGCRTP